MNQQHQVGNDEAYKQPLARDALEALRATPLSLMDKAYALRLLRSEWEKELGSPLSDRAFVRTVNEKVCRLSDRHARNFNYAIKLDRVIPQAMRSGITFRQLDAIKQAEQSYLYFCEGKIEQMPQIFDRHMAEHDGDTFNFDAVSSVIESELAERINIPANQIKLAIKDLLSKSGPNKRSCLALSSLQQQGFILAKQIAQMFEMGDLIVQRQSGTGFMVEKTTYPPPNIIAWGVWLLLMTLSERCIDHHQSTFWQDHPFYNNHKMAIQLFLFQSGTDPEVLSDYVFQDLFQLIENCRQLRKHFTADILWPEP